MTGHEVGVTEGFVAAPELVVFAAPPQKFAQALHRGQRPDQVPTGQRHEAVEVAPYIEFGTLARCQTQDEMRAHQVQHRGFFQAWRQQPLQRVVDRTLGFHHTSGWQVSYVQLSKQGCICVITITQPEVSWKTLLQTVCMQYATQRNHNPSDIQGHRAGCK